MSDKMTPIPIETLMEWILAQRQEEGAVFGVERAYIADPACRLPLFGEWIEMPFGPAAGPHTQLAQNIVAAYYAGARFFELKTVQTLDGEALSKCVPKPCIAADDEGYNCEWSTELTVEEAYEEYVKAWFLLKLLSREFGLGDPEGFVFNMSVGYDYAGITSEKIDNFIEGMKDASKSPIFNRCKDYALDNLRLFDRISARFIEGISPHVSTSITLSTLHGCPPQEIERIAAYLITQKGLNTFVKCNPTILGYETARYTLDQMGYDYIAFDDHHFKEDLQYKDAAPMFKRLRKLAAEKGKDFGLKLSNTFPVDVTRGELPSEEMYMSGRALYPLTMEMASRFTAEYDGRMRLSFSGGADAFNMRKLFNAGIWPVTVATTILKPGGYARFTQLANRLKGEEFTSFTGVRVGSVQALANSALSDAHHVKPIKPIPSKKIGEKLPLINCFTAPCKHGCPIGQDIPEYISLLGQGRYLKALQVITEKNPLPFITGRICSHRCMDKCMRGYYEEPVRIRNAKLDAARNGFEALLGEAETPVMTGDKRVAVIGGGPAGLSAAYFLGRAGLPVTLFEKREMLGGIVRQVIPAFRISDHAIDRDIQLVSKMGVRFILGQEAPPVHTLKNKGYDYVLLAVGAWSPGALSLERGESMNVLDFLAACKAETLGDIGKHVLVVGGGNAAMDAARAAKRVEGVESVTIVYRRTKRYMPADAEELQLVLHDGVQFEELVSPVSLAQGKLKLKKMRLGEPDESGRRRPVETDETFTLPCDTLIAAVGEKPEAAFFLANGLTMDARGLPVVNPETLESSIAGVYVLGDANRGPATVVEAIADAQKASEHILGYQEDMEIPEEAVPMAIECRKRCGTLTDYANAPLEAERCLNCNISCEVCVQVCPNRANMALTVLGCDQRQILHIDRMCNECGNCAVFCPYDAAPYRDKLTLFHEDAQFQSSGNPGFLHLGEKRFRVRLDGEVRDVDIEEVEPNLPQEIEALLWSLATRYDYML